MNKILLFLCLVILVSCHTEKGRDFLYGTGGINALEDVLNSEYVQLDFYLDVGLAKIKSGHLYILKGISPESVVDAVLSDDLCGRRGFAKDSLWLGSVIDQDYKHVEFLNSTCLLYIDHFFLDVNTSLKNVLENIFRNRVFEITRVDSLYIVSYTGNELSVEGNSLKKYEKKENKNVFAFSSTEPHHTIVLRNEKTDLHGYKPLRLDPSILPLESPGYKELREQEEALK